MKTFGNLKIGDTIYSRKLEANLIEEQTVEDIQIINDSIIVKLKDGNICFNCNKSVDTKSSILYCCDKKYCIQDLTSTIKMLREEIYMCQQQLQKYENI